MGSVASTGGLGSSVFTASPCTNAAQVVLSGAIGNIYQVEVDATSNPGEDVYVPLYNSAAPVVGTTQPRMLLKGKSGTKKTYTFKRGITAFATACSVACVREKGASGGPTSPSGTVSVTVRYTQ